jgi:hypothetical protein
MFVTSRKIFAAVLIAGSMFMAADINAAPKSELWEKWAAHDAQSTAVVDHSNWDKFLKTYVKDDPSGLNKVDYAGVTVEDKKALDDYVDALAVTPVLKLNRAQQQPYWINLYNALTVKVVVDHFPVKSIRDIDISPGLFSSGPWGKKLVEIAGEQVSLDDIEHRILRPIWKDPRIHYAVNCASVGCPDLSAQAYTAENTDAMLSVNAVAYINSPRGVRVSGNDVIVSSIYDWFQADFDGTEKGVISHLLPYAKGDRKKALEKVSEISDYDYDWALNGL